MVVSFELLVVCDVILLGLQNVIFQAKYEPEILKAQLFSVPSGPNGPGYIWLWLKEPVPKRNPDNWKHGPRPAVCPADRLILSAHMKHLAKEILGPMDTSAPPGRSRTPAPRAARGSEVYKPARAGAKWGAGDPRSSTFKKKYIYIYIYGRGVSISSFGGWNQTA